MESDTKTTDTKAIVAIGSVSHHRFQRIEKQSSNGGVKNIHDPHAFLRHERLTIRSFSNVPIEVIF